MKKLKSKVTIDIEYGSDFQKECGDETLEAIINAWKDFREQTHKKNKVIITYEK